MPEATQYLTVWRRKPLRVSDIVVEFLPFEVALARNSHTSGQNDNQPYSQLSREKRTMPSINFANWPTGCRDSGTVFGSIESASLLVPAKKKAWGIFIQNGKMEKTTFRGARMLFFTNFRCGSSTRLSGPAKLTFAVHTGVLASVSLRLLGPADGSGGVARISVGRRKGNSVAFGRSQVIPENASLAIDRDIESTFRSSERCVAIRIESDREELNLTRLSWAYADDLRAIIGGRP